MTKTEIKVFEILNVPNRILVRAGEGAAIAELPSPCAVAELGQEEIQRIKDAYFERFPESVGRESEFQFINWTKGDEKRCMNV